MLCYFCGKHIEAGDKDMHHPDKEQFPNWTEPAHRECHHNYHRDAGHFKEWGSWSPYAGHEGLKRALKKYPTFHRMGGLKRAKTAKRSANGRFV